ncbi:DMT family transporter [Noviherbaspirillum massiliense]|uniref:DMT family transporter n=1 Tax=Noviherbaspirillum massiliense TaxID=1465823 RepID=UPI000300C548|nr:DMT family transporter [Noviherbaspirillum massiliense]
MSFSASLQSRSPRSLGLFCLMITSLGWGINWPAMKFLLREWPPLFARGVAGVAAACLLAAIAAAAGQRLRVPRELLGRLTLGAFTNVFAWMGFSTLSLRWLNVGQAALLVYTMPLWATLLAWPLLGKRPSLRDSMGLALCIAGVALLFGGPDASLGTDQLAGALFALGAAFFFALGTVALKPTPLPPFTALAWQVGIGCAPMLVLGLLFEQPDFHALSAGGWGVMAYMTVMPMGICYLTWFAALRRLPPATASIATLLTPIIGVTAAALSLGEPLGLRQLLAMALTIGGVAFVLRKA